MSDINPYDYIVAKSRLQDLLESAEALRGRVFDVSDSMNGTAWEYCPWSHMEPTPANHLVRVHGELSKAIEALEDAIAATLN